MYVPMPIAMFRKTKPFLVAHLVPMVLDRLLFGSRWLQTSLYEQQHLFWPRKSQLQLPCPTSVCVNQVRNSVWMLGCMCVTQVIPTATSYHLVSTMNSLRQGFPRCALQHLRVSWCIQAGAVGCLPWALLPRCHHLGSHKI